MTIQRLVDAVKRGDISEARRILDLRPELANTDMAENNEHRALHYAVFERSQEMVRLLMSFGADARKGIYPHRDATTVFAIASDRGYDDIVAIIEEEERGRHRTAVAPEELFDRDCWETGRAKAMLEADPSLVHSSNANGWTPLHAAAATLDLPKVEWLLERGAQVNRRVKGGGTPLDAAASGRGWGKAGSPRRFREVAKVLLERGAEMTAIPAVALGEADWVRKQHAAGALENGSLTISVIHDRPEMLELLLQLGCHPDERVRLRDVEEEVYSQALPLWKCAAEGKLAMAETLLQAGANPNVHVYASGSPVYSAYRQHDSAMLELLKRYGGVVDPVTIGLFHEREMAKQMLLDEAEGRVPIEVLEGRNVSEDLLRGSADSGDVEIVRMALPGVDWSRHDDRWYWILMQAIWAPSPDCFRLILARCDVNLRHPRFGRTLLHDVAGLGGAKTAEKSPEFAALLLDAGARIDERDDILQSTPLGWACRWGRIELVKFLLARGADPVESDAPSWATPKAWAQKMEHSEILRVLG